VTMPAIDGADGARSGRSEGEAERKKLLARAGVVGAGTLASRLLGLARDMALAAVFRRDETDAFFVAFTIPNALRQLLGEGAISSAVVPLLSAKIASDGDAEARRFFAKVRGLSLLALSAATALGMIFARPLTELFAGGYEGAQLERCVHMTRIVFPYIFLVGTAALGMAALHAKRRFAVAAFAPALLNVAFLITAFTLPAPLAAAGIDRADAIAYGALLGGVLQVAAQWPALRAIGFAPFPRLDLADPSVREVFRRIAPMTFGIGVYYIDLVVSRRFLSELGEGAQSYFTWAMRVCDFPQGIFVMALSTAALPSLSALAARGERDELAATFAHGLRLAMFVAVPATVLVATLPGPLVAALFQRGEFDATAVRETALALAWQGSAIWTVAGVRQIVPVFHALGDTRTPVIVSAIDLAAFIVLAVVLRGAFGHVAISVAVAGSSFVQAALLLAALRVRLGALPSGAIAGSLARTLAASLAAAAGAAALARALASSPRAVPGVAGAVAFVVLFAGAAAVLRSPELAEVTAGVRRRLARGRSAR